MNILFLLPSAFLDHNIPPKSQMYFCPDCALLEGMLSYFPDLRKLLDIRYIAYERPRTEIVALLGEEHQNCPLLIIDENIVFAHNYADLKTVNGIRFLNSGTAIAQFLANQYGFSMPHP
ncbi:DUF3088 family protein [Flavobacterium sp.]|uniref:DUF3088 family protein n=1 Tax=Flavobacterium sp. TaxID=239 RepID=UPI002614D0CE|nr:DUF3088 family protein [Flavobacterium sp.]